MYRALSRKMTCRGKASYDSTPPCMAICRKGVIISLEIVSENFQFSTRRTRILLGCIICAMLLPDINHKCHGQNSGTMKKF